MNEKEIDEILRNDTILREAVRRCNQNVPQMPADLNERIMKRLQESVSKKPDTLLIAMRIITSMAALWLTGLFLFQQITCPAPQPNSEKNIQYYTAHLSHGSTLENVYTGRQRQNKPTQISYTQLKRMLYEKN